MFKILGFQLKQNYYSLAQFFAINLAGWFGIPLFKASEFRYPDKREPLVDDTLLISKTWKESTISYNFILRSKNLSQWSWGGWIWNNLSKCLFILLKAQKTVWSLKRDIFSTRKARREYRQLLLMYGFWNPLKTMFLHVLFSESNKEFVIFNSPL